MLTRREQEILQCIRREPMATQQAIADQLGLSRSAVAVHIMNLGHKGVIRGRAYVLNEDACVVAIGGAGVDVAGRPERSLKRGDSNPGTIAISAGGVARNVAENLVLLGRACRLISAVGEDSHGDFLLQHCRQCGIDVDSVLRLPGERTSSYLAVIDDASQLDVGIADMRIMERLDGDAVLRLRPDIAAASAIFIDANLGDEALDCLFGDFGDRFIVADPVSAAKAPKLAPYLSSIDVLKPTLAEAAALLGRSLRTRRQARSLARGLREHGVGEVYLSSGAHGLWLEAEGISLELPPPDAPAPTSVSGAGDAMTAAILDARLSGLAADEAAARGLAAAGIALSATAATAGDLSRAALDAVLGAAALG